MFQPHAKGILVALGIVALAILILLFSLPYILVWEQKYETAPFPEPFPVSVDPEHKSITPDPSIETTLSSAPALTGAAANAGNLLSDTAAAIVSSNWYQMFAASDIRAVVIEPGYRKEEVARAFADSLGWGAAEQKTFLSHASSSVSEGEFSPGTYVFAAGSDVSDATSAIEDRFATQILARYPTSTDAIVPLPEALTIASMIERETSDWQEMRQISGIIWNRIFTGMNLQIDATVQYAKASAAKTPPKNWWPVLGSKDKYIKSPYNTYLNDGLPPAPISNPSVAAVIAALNPIKTSCLFYFHDADGNFHCSNTYEEHVAMLKKYYGQGK
jgi:UPF0755 protein